MKKQFAKTTALIMILMFCLSIPVSTSASGQTRAILSDMTDTELWAFLAAYEIEIPANFASADERGLRFIRSLILKIEQVPDCSFLFGRTDLLAISEALQYAVNDYYGISLDPIPQTTASHGLRYSTVYEVPENSAPLEFTDSTVVKATDRHYSSLMSFRQDLIVCVTDTDGYEFELNAADGSFYSSAAYVSELRINSTGGVIWTDIVPNVSKTEFYDSTETYVDVLIKRDGQYVGYTVVLITMDDPSIYRAQVLACKETTPEQAQEAGLSRKILEEYIQKVKDEHLK